MTLGPITPPPAASPVAVVDGGTGADFSGTGPGHVIQASAGAVLTILKHNLAGGGAPGATDDASEGYAAGSLWVDTTNDQAWICVDPTTDAAVWRQLVPGAGTLTFSYSGPTAQFAARPLYTGDGDVTTNTVAGPTSSQSFGVPVGTLRRLEVHCVDGTSPTMDQVIVRRIASAGLGGTTDVYDSSTGLGLGRGSYHAVANLAQATADGDWLQILVKSLNANTSRYRAIITLEPS